jgi:hypothetical protein
MRDASGVCGEAVLQAVHICLHTCQADKQVCICMRHAVCTHDIWGLPATCGMLCSAFS